MYLRYYYIVYHIPEVHRCCTTILLPVVVLRLYLRGQRVPALRVNEQSLLELKQRDSQRLARGVVATTMQRRDAISGHFLKY